MEEYTDIESVGWHLMGYKLNEIDEKVAQYYHQGMDVWIEFCQHGTSCDLEAVAMELGRKWQQDVE